MQTNLFHTPQETKKSKLLTRYQKLMKDIENKKRQHEKLNEGINLAMPKIHAELIPLVAEQTELHLKRLIRLDEVFVDIKLSDNQHNMFIDYMIEELEALNETYSGTHMKTIEDLLAKYTEEEYGDEEPDYEELAADIEVETGCEVDLDELKAKGFDKYMEDHSEEFMQSDSKGEGFFNEESGFDFFDNLKDEPKKKKSKKQTKRELQEEEENKMLALDAKAIYIRLIKKYHPDRQQDEAKKLEYTEISKNVTKAYQENDFMALLQLQITYLEDTEHDATMLADDMLQRYNKILQSQLNEVNFELQRAKYSASSLIGDFFNQDFSFSEMLFERKKSNIILENESISHSLVQSYKQKKGWFKEFLKEIKMNNEMEEAMMFLDFMKW